MHIYNKIFLKPPLQRKYHKKTKIDASDNIIETFEYTHEYNNTKTHTHTHWLHYVLRSLDIPNVVYF